MHPLFLLIQILEILTKGNTYLLILKQFQLYKYIQLYIQYIINSRMFVNIKLLVFD